MSGEHPDDERDDPEPNTADPSRSGPAPHRPGLWLGVFLIVVGLTVLVTIVGFLADAGRTAEASMAARSPTQVA